MEENKIKMKKLVKDIWGIIPDLEIDGQKAKEEMREGWKEKRLFAKQSH
ncbi:hypothetical protein J4457_00920 [Candidatus Woesearchaeota archaeon]|nr:hypothetical protein [Candidatus Woesearchaeota archaeon]